MIIFSKYDSNEIVKIIKNDFNQKRLAQYFKILLQMETIFIEEISKWWKSKLDYSEIVATSKWNENQNYCKLESNYCGNPFVSRYQPRIQAFNSY